MIQMTELRPFFTSIFAVDIDVDLEFIKTEIYKIRENNAGRIVSNMGGWQSEDIIPKDNVSNFNFLSPLIQHVETVADSIYSKYKVDVKSPTVSNCWININGKYNFNMYHNHPLSYFSACYYVKIPKDSGTITFKRPDILRECVPFYENVEHNFGDISIDPKEKMLLVFPSFLQHSVTSNLTEDEDSDRISIAFNLN